MNYKRPRGDDRFLLETELEVGDKVVWHKINNGILDLIKGKIIEIFRCSDWGNCCKHTPHLRAKLDSYKYSANIAYLEKIN
jgi:hypothetical protein